LEYDYEIFTRIYGHTNFEQEFVIVLQKKTATANQNTLSNKYFVLIGPFFEYEYTQIILMSVMTERQGISE
jgi:hypothetical protein